MRYRLVIRRHGVSGGMPGYSSGGGTRGRVGGWSSGAAGRNARWLQSVTPPNGLGCAVTLTLRDSVSSQTWCEILRRYIRVLSRHKVVSAFHYVVEWQRRGVPHVHFAIYVNAENSAWETWLVWLRRWWVDISANAEMHACYAKPIVSYVGWLEYVAKHGARGAGHYQRSGLPDDWVGSSSGRMWGYGGSWPDQKIGHLSCSKKDYVRFCRVVRRYMVSVGRPKKIVRNVLESARGYPRGVFEWMPYPVTLQVLSWVVSWPDSSVEFLES